LRYALTADNETGYIPVINREGPPAIQLLKILLSSSRGRANIKMLSSELGKPLATIKISNDFVILFLLKEA